MDRPASLLDKERAIIPWLAAAFTIAAATGFITRVLPTHGAWAQFTWLAHIVAGTWLAVLSWPYLPAHFRRTLSVRRPAMLTGGILAAALFLLLYLTGAQIAIFGQSEALRWIGTGHTWLAYSAVVLLAAHLLLHRLLRSRRRRQGKESRFFSVPRDTLPRVLTSLGVAVFGIGACTGLYALVPSPYHDEAMVKPYEMPYGKHPFRPSQTETSTGGFLDVKRVGDSAECGACHTAITRQWQASMHAHAASDKAYDTSISLLVHRQGIVATRYCEGCHAPTALLSGELSKGGKLDLPSRLHEGVSCRSCHNIDRVVNLKGVGSYEFRPVHGYLFAGYHNLIATKIHNYLIRIQPRQHRQEMARPVLPSPTLCATCHAQFMDKDVNHWGWVKMQDEFTGWVNSPYSGQSERSFAQTSVRTCVDCHFPKQHLADPSADVTGMTVSHRALGANTAIPYFRGDRKQLEEVQRFLQADRVRVSIDAPTRTDAVRGVKPVNPGVASRDEEPGYFYLGEKVDLNVVVSNIGVGHEFPGGTIDLNQAWVYVRVVDAQNRVIFEDGGINAKGMVDPKAHFYRTLAINREGKHVWQHDLFNMVGDSYRKVIPSGASDVVPFRFAIPDWAKGPMTIAASVRYRKLNQQYAQWALKSPGIRLPITDMARDSVQVALRQRREAR
jgi:hypothetical protein